MIDPRPLRDADDFRRRVHEAAGPVIVAFLSPGCSSCRAQRVALEALARERPDLAVLLCPGTLETPLFRAHDVRALPTTARFEGGRLRAALAGFQGAAALAGLLSG